MFAPKPPLRSVGTDPDYRFTLANERTFLAWLRTGLALLAGRWRWPAWSTISGRDPSGS